MEIKTLDDVKIISIMERFDAYAAREVEDVFTDLIQNGSRKILCDFSQTEYVASAGLRVLLSTIKVLQKKGGQLILCALKPYVLEIFEIAGFTQIFTIHDSVDTALKNFE